MLYVAIDLVVKLMERSEVCQIKTDARYAYGATGRYWIFFKHYSYYV